MRLVAILLFSMALISCSPQFRPGGDRTAVPALKADNLVTADQVSLPVRHWSAKDGQATAILIALHGFNDYSLAFAHPASWWAEAGLTVYAYDQRGFGQAPHIGLWSSTRTMTEDLDDALSVIGRRHPDVPIYLLGSSMGAAVILSALGDRQTKAARSRIAGVVLVGPAVWGPTTMNPLYRYMLWMGAHTMPANHLTGEGLRIKPSDNVPMLRALGRDPLVIKSTRVDTLYGLVQLMGTALENAPHVAYPVLVLGAADDQLIPGHAHQELLKALKTDRTEAIYPEGFHMLLRDLQAKTVWKDILSWVNDKKAPLPSGLGHKIKLQQATVR